MPGQENVKAEELQEATRMLGLELKRSVWERYRRRKIIRALHEAIEGLK